ncbi:Hypothetical protein CINCED_3A021443, partial [Cinara cedri]
MMCNYLPYKGIKWCNPDLCNAEKILRKKDGKENGYILEVGLKYPEELHDLHSGYPLVPLDEEESDIDEQLNNQTEELTRNDVIFTSDESNTQESYQRNLRNNGRETQRSTSFPQQFIRIVFIQQINSESDEEESDIDEQLNNQTEELTRNDVILTSDESNTQESRQRNLRDNGIETQRSTSSPQSFVRRIYIQPLFSQSVEEEPFRHDLDEELNNLIEELTRNDVIIISDDSDSDDSNQRNWHVEEGIDLDVQLNNLTEELTRNDVIVISDESDSEDYHPGNMHVEEGIDLDVQLNNLTEELTRNDVIVISDESDSEDYHPGNMHVEEGIDLDVQLNNLTEELTRNDVIVISDESDSEDYHPGNM